MKRNLQFNTISLLLFFLMVLPSFSQGGGTPGGSRTVESMLGSDDKESPYGETTEAAPIERSVEPSTYRVGPSDRLLISATGRPTPIPVVVGYDNVLILPRGIPPVNVTDMTLAQLATQLDSIFRARSPGWGEISVSLLQPRAIFVEVMGAVLAPGRYVTTSADRVSTAIDMANRLPEELASADDELINLSKLSVLGEKSGHGSRNLGNGTSGGGYARDVRIRHADGSVDRADLVRYRALGHEWENPTLREGDQILVQQADPFGRTISIAGGVVNPVVGLPYRQGDRLDLLLGLAAGVRDEGEARRAYVMRDDVSGEVKIAVDLTDSLAVASFQLQASDQVIVPIEQRSVGVRSGVVTIEGEVVRPQAYAIIPGKTTLRDVIQQAGGFTPFASLNGSYVRRPDDPLALRPSQQVVDPKSGMATSELALEDTLRYMFDQQVQQNLVSADFVSIFKRGDLSRDVVLQNGDAIVIPRERHGVYVFGRIPHPGFVTYREGAPYEYYINQAGGYTTAAAPSRVAVEKFGTGVWEGVCCTEIESGDRIYVPGERDTPARTALEQTATYLGIAAGVLTITEVIIRIVDRLTPNE